MKEGRKRRSSNEVRAAILKASVKLFLRHGYEATGTKAIAVAAQVQEPLIFRHFGSKAQLLEKAVLFSLETFVQEFEREFDPREDALDKRVARYTKQLYELLVEERELIIALFASSRPARSAHGSNLHRSLARLFDKLEEMGRSHHRRGGLDPWFAVRLTFGLVVSTIVLEDWLFPAESASKKKQLAGALVKYVVGGSMRREVRPEKPKPTASSSKRKRASP